LSVRDFEFFGILSVRDYVGDPWNQVTIIYMQRKDLILCVFVLFVLEKIQQNNHIDHSFEEYEYVWSMSDGTLFLTQ
jgi:hypothetical protein